MHQQEQEPHSQLQVSKVAGDIVTTESDAISEIALRALTDSGHGAGQGR